MKLILDMCSSKTRSMKNQPIDHCLVDSPIPEKKVSPHGNKDNTDQIYASEFEEYLNIFRRLNNINTTNQASLSAQLSSGDNDSMGGSVFNHDGPLNLGGIPRQTDPHLQSFKGIIRNFILNRKVRIRLISNCQH